MNPFLLSVLLLFYIVGLAFFCVGAFSLALTGIFSLTFRIRYVLYLIGGSIVCIFCLSVIPR